MTLDSFTPESIVRLWLLFATASIAVTLGGALLLSRALEQSFRNAAQRNHPTQPNLVSLLPSLHTRNRLSVVGHHEAPPSRAPNIDPERSNVLSLQAHKNSASRG